LINRKRLWLPTHNNHSVRDHSVWLRTLAATVIVLAACLAVPDRALSQTPPSSEELQFGKKIYQEKATCGYCHGWAGDGEGDPQSEGKAAILRTSKLTRDELIEVISCGRPGAAMPHFNSFAYSEDACYGMKDADVGAAKPPGPPRSLQPREIAAVADYLLAKIVGAGPVTKAQCLEYFGEGKRCERYP
jgi:mono/diheme cytochrome c family protein